MNRISAHTENRIKHCKYSVKNLLRLSQLYRFCFFFYNTRKSFFLCRGRTTSSSKLCKRCAEKTKQTNAGLDDAAWADAERSAIADGRRRRRRWVVWLVRWDAQSGRSSAGSASLAGQSPPHFPVPSPRKGGGLGELQQQGRRRRQEHRWSSKLFVTVRTSERKTPRRKSPTDHYTTRAPTLPLHRPISHCAVDTAGGLAAGQASQLANQPTKRATANVTLHWDTLATT